MILDKSDFSIKCSVVVNSCDKYSEAWEPFFELMSIYWPDCPYPFFLNTEAASYNFQRQNVNVKTLNSLTKNESWSLRLKNVLKRIDTEYVIVLLEDFFLQDLVKQNEITKCLDWMEKDSEIAAFYYKKITGFETESSKYTGYIEMAEDLKYKFNCQAALWNRKALINALGDNQTPWQFETEASTEKRETEKKFYCVNWESKFHLPKKDIFPYLYIVENGYGIWQAKWLWNNEKLFKKHKIKANYTLGKFSRISFLFMKWKKNSDVILPLLQSSGLIKLLKKF